MILKKENLEQYLKNMRISIPEKFARELLEQYGQPVTDDEGHVFEYSEQDISEQLRKSIQQYLEGRILKSQCLTTG